MITDIKGKTRQETVEVTGEGDQDYLRMTKLGALFSADWRYQLAAAGFVYTAHIGTLTAGADVSMITGGGNGTTVDSDQPEMELGVDAGYYLIPLEIIVVCDVDIDANDEYGEIIAFADRSQAPPTTNASGTSITAVNNLDGGGSFPGRVWGASTADITDPVLSELLDMEYVNAAEFVSNGTATNLTNGIVYRLKMGYNPTVPTILQGPCQLVVCFGGTAAVTGMAKMVVACVPTAHFS